MATVENALLRQMQKLAASMNAMQGAASQDKSAQASVSFREMLRQPGNKVSENSLEVRDIKDKLGKDDRKPDAELQPVVQPEEKEELKAELLGGNPNAVNVLDLFRPDIVENTEQVEAVIDPIPQETVEGAAMDLGEQAPEMEADVDAGVGAEVSMEQQPRDFRQTMEEAPQETDRSVQTPQQQQTAPERPVRETAEKPEQEIEVHVERAERAVDTDTDTDTEDTEESGGEAAAAEQPVFHETQAVPVKVGERYEVVDTEKPEMDNQLAKTVNDAVQLGQDRVEIRLNPQNLGSLVIEMTKDAGGVLQVVLHAATPKAEGVLSQHLNNLHTALQGYGHEEVRLEVQRGQQSEQQNFRQADPDGRGQHHHRQQQERQEEQHSGEEFMQKLRLGLFGMED